MKVQSGETCTTEHIATVSALSSILNTEYTNYSPVALKLSKFFFSSSMLRVYWSVLVVVRGKAAAVGDGYSFYCDSLLSSDWTLSLYTADSAGVHQQISYHTSNWKIFKSKYVIFWAINNNSTENL